jgi:ADP-heptose:LPS heptosyltransferase
MVLWGPGEQAIAEGVAAASNGSAAVSPSTTIGQLFELTKAAAIMVSGDTGPMHIAGAMGTPLVGIFGPTDPGRNGPWADNDLVLSRFKGCECKYQRKCHISSWCMLDIAPREVLTAVDRRLSSPRHG